MPSISISTFLVDPLELYCDSITSHSVSLLFSQVDSSQSYRHFRNCVKFAMSSPVWFITASSSGFGKGIALAALKKGHRVVATARSTSRIADLKEAGAVTMPLDVTDSFDNIKKTVDDAAKATGQIDYLINAAGYILEGAIEEATPEETYKQFNTNVFGALNVTRAALPHMRARRTGVVAMFGSLGSWRSGAGFVHYAATKWACSAVGEGLFAELAPFGISGLTIEPGYFRSGFLNPGARLSTRHMNEYDGSAVGAARERFDATDNKQLGDVEKGCQVVVDVLTKSGMAEGRDIPMRLVLGSDCEAAIRRKCEETLSLLDEWKDVIRSTDYPEGQ